jgi:DNA-binding NtrC family response regulator
MDRFDQLILGNSPELKQSVNTAKIIAATDVTTLIHGECGTGKELLAEGIHATSRRQQGPFIKLNCASLPESLAESLLFGHAKGAFTGATNSHIGHFRSAHGGTLFLDEIAELPLNIQSKLLRFLESGECHAVGEIEVHRPNVRVLAATHRNLLEEVERGRFREDLFYRLNVVSITMPALRERSSDIIPLLTHFTRQCAKKYSKQPPIYSKEALSMLKRHAWPGNVRELRNLAERMTILSSGLRIGVGNLPAEITVAANRQGSGELFSLPDQGIVLTDLEADIISQALDRTNGNRSKAARLLGLTRDTLLYRIKKYALG